MKKLFSILAAAVSALTISSFFPAAHAESELADSGINYKEAVGTIQNPGVGYTSTVWAVCKPGDTKVYNPTGSIVLFFIDIGAFSSGANGTVGDDGNYTEGTDYDLDDLFFDAWRQTFDNCRKNGCMIGLRFRYDANGKENPEPATFDKVLDHIAQIKQSGIIDQNRDIIAFVETGFVGKWGEQHGGKYTTTEYKARLLKAMYEAIPAPVPLTVRTPDTFAEFAGVKRSELDDDRYYDRVMIYDPSTVTDHPVYLPDYSRIGLYDDGYMGSDSDLGTYTDRKTETNWLNRFTENTYFGGEFSGNTEYAMKFDTYLPENAIPEMYKTRLSYINGNIFQIYKDFTFGSEYDIEGVDNSAYYGQSVFQFIRDHIGYRFVLRKAENTASVSQGGELKMRFSVENTGFANVVFSPYSYLILEKDGYFYQAKMPVSVHDWKSCKTAENELTWQLPDGIRPGKWNIYMRIAAITDNTEYFEYDKALRHPNYGIRFANEGIWNPQLGANYLGSFEVSGSGSHGTNNSLRCISPESTSKLDTFPMSLDCNVTVDGNDTTGREWSEKELITRNDDCSLYVRADNEAMYVMAEMPDGAKAPVYNLEVNNNGERYWLYYSSNGFVYFNHDSYSGCQCCWNGKTVEFRVPFKVMDIEAGKELASLRVFLQDSGNEWVLLGDITAKNVKLPMDIPVYSAEADVYLAEGKYKSLRVKCAVPDVKYQWYHNGDPISNAEEQTYTVLIESSEDYGNYSVRMTTPDGISKTVSMANILPPSAAAVSSMTGDANCDGHIDMSDAVIIMQCISNPDKYGENGSSENHITSYGRKNGDVVGNNGLTVADAQKIQEYLLGVLTTL